MTVLAVLIHGVSFAFTAECNLDNCVSNFDAAGMCLIYSIYDNIYAEFVEILSIVINTKNKYFQILRDYDCKKLDASSKRRYIYNLRYIC